MGVLLAASGDIVVFYGSGGGGSCADRTLLMVCVAHALPDAWFEEDQEIYVHPKDPYVI